MFASAKNCQCKQKTIEFALVVVWNTLAIKIVDLNLGYDNKMADHISNSTVVLKLVSGSFCIQKCNLRPTSYAVAYFELREKYLSFFAKNMIAMTYWFQYKWRAY